MTKLKHFVGAAAGALLLAAPAGAATWSDLSVSSRVSNSFSEPFNSKDVRKHIVALSYADGYSYGGNFLNLDLLKSDASDQNAREAYLVYRHTLDLGKVTGAALTGPGWRGVGLTAGLDWNTKNDTGYGSRKRMLVLGPTLMLDVPGFANVSLLALWESNAPTVLGRRYRYDTHWMLAGAWGIPLGDSAWALEGYANYIGAKGRNEFGGPTAPETNVDAQLMYDLGPTLSLKPRTLKVGVEYQYWRNKFGNPPTVVGSVARTPMLRAEYHF